MPAVPAQDGGPLSLRLLPAPTARRPRYRLDYAHVGQRAFQRHRNLLLAADRAREGVALDGVLIAGVELLGVDAAAEQVAAVVEPEPRRPVRRRVERDLDFYPALRSEDL